MKTLQVQPGEQYELAYPDGTREQLTATETVEAPKAAAKPKKEKAEK